MTQLILTNRNILSVFERNIADSFKTPYLKDFDSKRLNSLCVSTYTTCLAKLGQKPKDEAEIVFESKLLANQILKFSWMTEMQLNLIIDNAIMGEYLEQGQTQVFYNIANFSQWAKKFYYELQKVEKKLIESNQKEETKPIPSDEQMKQDCINTINDYVSSVIKAREQGKEYLFPFGGLHWLYDIADGFGIINFSKERKKQILEMIKKTNQNLPIEAIIPMAKGQAYKMFIWDLADMDLKLDKNGDAI